MEKGLKQYLTVENPHIWLFNCKEPNGRYSIYCTLALGGHKDFCDACGEQRIVRLTGFDSRLHFAQSALPGLGT